MRHDIALIKLKERIEFNNNVQPIILPTYDNPERVYPVVATGWGVRSVIISLGIFKY